MGLEDLNRYLEKIKADDSELVAKLVLLGGKEKEVENELQQMISQELEPDFGHLARRFKEGKNALKNIFEFPT